MKNTFTIIRPKTLAILLLGLIALSQNNNLQSRCYNISFWINNYIAQATSIKNRVHYKSDDVDDLLQGVITNKA